MKESQRESTWNEIAEKMKIRNSSSRKTGKQCRERWANQLDPRIKRTENWTKEENETLFRLHFELGNKWSEICSHIPGRTDNCVKNHFYSTMRRGMRKVNSYIENVRRKSNLAKTFKNEILNKILALCEGRNDEKFQFSTKAKDLAIQIKTDLIQLSLELTDVDEENEKFKEQVFEEISEFSRNCRKRKTKKCLGLSSEAEEDCFEKKRKMSPYSKEIKEIKLQEIANNNGKEKEILNTLNVSPIFHFASINQPIKLPLFQLTKPIQLSEQSNFKLNFHNEVETQTLNNFKGEQTFERFNSFKAFSFPLAEENTPNILRTKEADEKEKEKLRNEENWFINSIPEMKKTKTCENKLEFGHIDFNAFPLIKPVEEAKKIKETVNSIFPSIIESQEISHAHSLKLKDHNINFAGEQNLGMSPFPFCYPHNNFEASSSATMQEEKFRSTRYDSHDFEDNSSINEKTGFKLVRRPSSSSNKGN